jgi:tRNA pseudouridine55 synthase
LLDKPEGPTAHDVVAAVRRSLGVRRVGHTGTLDPFASGLLVILVGRATRLAQYQTGLVKEYVGTIKLGETTDTCDSTGRILAQSDSWSAIDDQRIRDSALSLTGTHNQVPPAYSAKKVAGQRAYRLARRGEHVELEPQEIEVLSFDIVERAGALVRFYCRVSSGTYVRALARDLGAELGCGGHLQNLRRESVGPFNVSESISLDAVSPSIELRPPLEAVQHLPVFAADEELYRRLVHGQSVEVTCETEGPVAVVSDGGLAAIAMASEGILKPKVVLEG